MKNVLRDSKKAIITLPAGVLLFPAISLTQEKTATGKKAAANIKVSPRIIESS
jgi:hypothetical protein